MTNPNDNPIAIIILSDGQTWESVALPNDPWPAKIRFISTEDFRALCEDRIDASDCIPLKPDIDLRLENDQIFVQK
jgi:hypothetical protein